METLNYVWSILMVVFGLGFVIFFHELGHFVMAKLGGVKVERFFVGFDPWGLRICSVKVGETVYGIGALPLGGYVSMLGEHTGEFGTEEKPAEGQPAPPTPTAPNPDPRAYHNRPVPVRMAIISAGVIMNAILGLACFAGSYAMGFKTVPAVIGGVAPGLPAYDAGLRSGDDIVAIDGREDPTFENLLQAVALSDDGQRVRFDVRRAGQDGLLRFDIEPRVDEWEKSPKIGVGPARDLVLDEKHPFEAPAGLGAGAKAPAGLKGGDRIVRAGPEGGPLQAVSTAQEFQEMSGKYRDRPLAVEVKHAGKAGGTATVVLPPVRFLDLGLRMAIGPVVGLRPDSPASRAGFRKGDRIVKFNGRPDFDPLRLPDDLQKFAREHPGKSATFEVRRPGAGGAKAEETVTLTASPDASATWVEPAVSAAAMDVPGLGLAYRVEPEVAGIRPGSPADGKIKPGARITAVRLPAPRPLDGEKTQPIDVTFEDPSNSWVEVFSALQQLPPGEVRLTLADKSEVTLTPAADPEWFNPRRGVVQAVLTRPLPPQALGSSFRRASRDAADNIDSVPKLFRSLFKSRVGKENVAGPIRIFGMGRQIASEGWAPFLRFLGMLNFSLAVINFLPIPPLDGGQFLVLAYEGVRRKPMPEAVLNRLLGTGLVLILALMVFVWGQDIYLSWIKNLISARR